jgi:uncharacterized protein DUF488
MTPLNVTTSTVFTIGHSSHEVGDFLSVLAKHDVKILCDVRSRPASFRFPQFNREPLEALLASAALRYEFFGEALGGRPADPRAYYSDGPSITPLTASPRNSLRALIAFWNYYVPRTSF